MPPAKTLDVRIVEHGDGIFNQVPVVVENQDLGGEAGFLERRTEMIAKEPARAPSCRGRGNRVAHAAAHFAW